MELTRRVPSPGRLVGALYALMIALTLAVSIVVWQQPVLRAVLLMGWGAILLWITLCGGLMWRHRDALRA